MNSENKSIIFTVCKGYINQIVVNKEELKRSLKY